MLVTQSVPDSWRIHGLQPTRLLCPWDFPAKDTWVGSHFLLQGILLTLGSNPSLPYIAGRFFTDWDTRKPKLVKKVFLQCRRPQFNSWVRKIPWRRDRLPIPVFLGCPCGSAGKESTCNVGDLLSIPGLERSLGEGKVTHSSILAWRIPWTVCSMGSQRIGVTFTFTSHYMEYNHKNIESLCCSPESNILL